MFDVRASAFSDNNWSVSIAHACAAWKQCVLVGDISIRVDGDRGNMQLAAPRALIQRLNIFQPMVETITAKIDFVFGHCVEHEGIVGIGRVTQRKEFSVLLRTAMHESLRGLCEIYLRAGLRESKSARAATETKQPRKLSGLFVTTVCGKALTSLTALPGKR